MIKRGSRFGPSIGAGTGRSPVVNPDPMSFSAARRGREFAGGYGTNTMSHDYFYMKFLDWLHLGNSK